ncbi:hypothetical protein IM660_10340 [Ruania alkalisoli]|uniref:Uncharacterized protein n=1 Tax=Ruania alkalisoli TaxID=2779775 RepID=A0A7M1SRC0_9MICO|nr:hypothetical protein [Ruania alkalisoli]QOR69133.1 hypothetical protein IM660_10340 [Ruania alkalisoli]
MNHTLATDAPEAEVLRVSRRFTHVRCPYCSREHKHVVLAPGAQRFAPACGMHLNPDDRARGYVFTTGKETS